MLVVIDLELEEYGLTRPRMRHVIDVVSSIDPLKSKTFMASNTVFRFVPSIMPISAGIVR